VLAHHASTPPRPPREVRPDVDVHPELEHFVLCLLSKSPADRYQTAREALRALERVRRLLDDADARRAARVAETPTARSAVAGPRRTVTTIWELPGLLEDSSRLAKLWDERVVAVADILWGPGRWPEPVAALVGEIRALERRVQAVEGAVAALHREIDAIEAEARERDAALRFDRLDLVARRCVALEAQSGGVEVSALARLAGRLGQSGAFDGVDGEAASVERLAALAAALDVGLDDIDARARALVRETRAAVAERQDLVHARAREVWELRAEQVPLTVRFLAALEAASSERVELAEMVGAVAEVAGAIQVYQSALRAVRETDP
jgi:hypothetical protein